LAEEVSDVVKRSALVRYSRETEQRHVIEQRECHWLNKVQQTNGDTAHAKVDEKNEKADPVVTGLESDEVLRRRHFVVYSSCKTRTVDTIKELNCCTN